VFFLGGSDDAFTNGVRLAIGRDPNAAADAKYDWLGRWLEGNALLGRQNRAADTFTSLVVGQNFFTPLEITDYEIDPTDRPYAGFTYLGVRADLTERAEFEPDPVDPNADRERPFQSQRQHAAEVNVGVIGPAAGAEPVQSSVHAVLRTHRIPKGWYTQIGTSLGVSGYYLVRQKIGWPFVDVVPHGGALLGTTQIYPFAGATVRVGWNMTGFPALIGRNTAIATSARPDWEVGLLAGGEGRYFLRNSFVQGTIFGGGDGVEAIRTVGEYRLGFWLRLLDWRLTYTMLRRSPEVAEVGPSERLYDSYGSISFAYEPGVQTPGSPRLDRVVNGWLGTVLDDFILEAGIGPDLYDGREPGVDETHGMHVAVGRALPGVVRDFDVALEVVGAGRELGPPPDPDGDHADRFLVNTLGTLRYRPLGGRLGPGEFHLRGGVGRAHAEMEITPGVPGERASPCPPGTALEGDDRRYCTRADEGTGYMVGAAYNLSWGRELGFNTDLSWNHLALEPAERFLALTFGFRWAPR
jgi:hypothetical protein